MKVYIHIEILPEETLVLLGTLNFEMKFENLKLRNFILKNQKNEDYFQRITEIICFMSILELDPTHRPLKRL